MVRRLLLVGACCLAAAGGAGAAADTPWFALDEAAIVAAFTGREFTGSDGQVQRYPADGSFQRAGRPGAARGHWRVERDELCVRQTQPRWADECFEVQRRGGQIRLLQDGYVVAQGRLHAIRRMAPR